MQFNYTNSNFVCHLFVLEGSILRIQRFRLEMVVVRRSALFVFNIIDRSGMLSIILYNNIQIDLSMAKINFL